ncbi:dihydrofolate reductase [bacterium]|nr:dihydrofolate reductase [bacterium]
MTIVSLIAAIDEKGGLGQSNQLLCHLPADLKQFKTLTWGKPIIMGRKTYDSIGRALPGRLNIVLSRQKLTIEGVTVVESLDQAVAMTQNEPEIMIIGGGQLFVQALPLSTRVYLTRIHHQFAADVFFPVLDEAQWICRETIDHQRDEKNPYDFTFCRYERL